MLFNSYEFLFLFLPVTLSVFWIIGSRFWHRVAISWLIMCSLLFYGWWNPSYLLLLICSVLFNYAIGLSLSSRQEGMNKKAVLYFGVTLNLLSIAYFKYFNFFVDNVNTLFGAGFRNETILLPLAISFFTFQQITFLVDSYRGETSEYNFLHYFLFVTFFPQLIAGPIVHHREMLPQFSGKKVYSFDLAKFNIGLTIFITGLFKKVIIADGVAQYSTPVFLAAEQGVLLSLFEGWIGALAYTFQLYFDFSGYSDMAIGIARMIGIKLPLNFNSPYKAVNIISFWRRWHITLSRFLRDYLYIPLGGNRAGRVRRHVNVMITMFLGGLWHGAGWTFIAWGVLHGFYLIINNIWISVRKALFRDSASSRLGRSLSVVVTFLSVVVGWVFFRATSFESAIAILKSMAGINGISVPQSLSGRLGYAEVALKNAGIAFSGISPNNVVTFEGLLWIVVLLFIVWALPNTQQMLIRFKPAFETYKGEIEEPYIKALCWKPDRKWALWTGIIAGIAVMGLSQVSEFLYFQF